MAQATVDRTLDHLIMQAPVPNNEGIAITQHTHKVAQGKLSNPGVEVYRREPEEVNRVISHAMARQMQGAGTKDLTYADGIVAFFNWLQGDDTAVDFS